MSKKANNLKYIGEIDNIKHLFLGLFKNFSSLTEEQQKAVEISAKNCSLGNGWSKFLCAQYISETAFNDLKKRFDKNEKKSSYCFYMDHAIPKTKYIINPISTIAKSNDSQLEKKIENIIENLHCVCFITKEQNDALNKAHLKSKMPSSFDERFPMNNIETGNLTLTEKEKFLRYFAVPKFDGEKIFKIKNFKTDTDGKLKLDIELEIKIECKKECVYK